MSKAGSFLAGFTLAAAACGCVWWFVLEPRARADAERAASAERTSLRAKRDASDAQGEADRERRLRLELADQVTELKRAFTAAPPKPSPMNGGHTPKPTGGDLAPELWDGARLRQEIMMIASAPRGVVASPRYPLVVRALKAHPDESLDLLTQVMQSELKEEKVACATFLGALGDPRGNQVLLAAWSAAKDTDLRHSVLRGLANLSGEEATPVLVSVWNDPAADSMSRLLAIHGLARRRHQIALDVAAGGAPGSTPPMRLQALQTFHAQAMSGEWKDTSLVAVFGKALLSGDGDPQRKLALTALEGFWSKDSLADLDAFAAAAGASELAARARKTADAIRAGDKRPEGAGVPPQKPGTPATAEPTEAPEPPK